MRVTDAKGRGIQGAVVYASDQACSRILATTAHDGSCILAGLSKGTYTVGVESMPGSMKVPDGTLTVTIDAAYVPPEDPAVIRSEEILPGSFAPRWLMAASTAFVMILACLGYIALRRKENRQDRS